MDENEASPRPWHVNPSALGLVFDVNGVVVLDLDPRGPGTDPRHAANAALIVAAVNAEWERAQAGKAMVEQWNAGVAILKPCQRDPVCDQRAGHEGPCRYEFPAGPPIRPPDSLSELNALLRVVVQPVWVLDSKGQPIPNPLELAGEHARTNMERREADARATLSSDCRLPLAHASGCECGRL